MTAEADVALLVLSTILFGATQGTHAALQILAYGRSDRNGDEDDRPRSFADHLLEEPVTTYFALALARAGSLCLLFAFSYRTASYATFAAGGPAAAFIVSVAVVLAVLMASHLLSLRSPERFVKLSRVVTVPLMYLAIPLAYPLRALIRRSVPALLETLAFPLLSLKRRIEMVGFGDGDEDGEEQALMSSVFEFGDTKVREIMVPRIDMLAVNINMNPDEALRAIVDAGHSRVPVFDETIDRIVGMIHTKDVLKRSVDGREFSLTDIRRDVHFVPESKKIDDLLTEFKQRKIHIAIVVDEYGGTAGLITLENILEELVGDIQDEFDSEEELMKVIDDDTALCNARVHLDDLNEQLGLDLEGDVDTLGGFLYELIGRVPRVGEVVERGDLAFTIESVVRQRIGQVRITGLAAAARQVEDGFA